MVYIEDLHLLTSYFDSTYAGFTIAIYSLHGVLHLNSRLTLICSILVFFLQTSSSDSTYAGFIIAIDSLHGVLRLNSRLAIICSILTFLVLATYFHISAFLARIFLSFVQALNLHISFSPVCIFCATGLNP